MVRSLGDSWSRGINYLVYCLIDSAIDGAVRGMGRALTALYQTWHDPEALKISEAARAFRNALCPDSKAPYLVFLIHDRRCVVENIKPYGMGKFSGDLVESANAVIKDMHNNYSNRAGGRGAKTNIGEAWLGVVQQCQAHIFLCMELPPILAWSPLEHLDHREREEHEHMYTRGSVWRAANGWSCSGARACQLSDGRTSSS